MICFLHIHNHWLYIFFFFWIIVSSSCFVVICLVQFCIILVRNGMLLWKIQTIIFRYHFYYIIDTVYIYPWKKLIKFWSILVRLYVKSSSRSFLIIKIIITRGVQLDNRVNPPGWRHDHKNGSMMRSVGHTKLSLMCKETN